MEESQSRQKSNTKVAQYEGQEDQDPIFKIKEDSNDKLIKCKPKPERDLELEASGPFKKGYMKLVEETLYSRKSLKEENFTNLLLFKKMWTSGSENLVRKSWYPCVPEKEGHMIEIQDIFGPNLGIKKKAQLVILEGAAGIGKSMLARQVRRAWKEGLLYRDRFEHVFFFSCRELAQHKQLSLAELIAQSQKIPTVPIRWVLSHPEKVLFILDGIDEPTWVLEEQNPELCLHWSQKEPVHTLLGSLLGKSILPEASFLLTARNTVLHKLIPYLGQPCQVEVLGFTEGERENYFYKYFAKQNVEIKDLMMLDSNPVLLTLCEVPWVCWLVCTCLKKQMEQSGEFSLTSQTTTALCMKYLSLTIPEQHMGTHLRALCSLAAEGICQRRTLFSESDLCKQGLAEDATDTFLKIGVLQYQPSSLSYSFAHLCLQEFFAAMSYILEDSEENNRIVETLVECYGRQNLFEAPTVRFLFGLLSKEGLKEMEKFFFYSLPGKKKLKLLWHILEKSQPHQPPCLGLLHCLYENQETELLTHVMHDLQGTIMPGPDDKAHTVLQTNVKHLVIQTDMELMVVTFCIQFCYHVRSLQLNMERQQGYELMAPRMVLYKWTPITDTSWKILFSNLKFTRNLEELDLSGNPLSYSAVQSLYQALRQPDCQLKTLWLVDCGLTSTYCSLLASVLSARSSLTELDLQLNDLGDMVCSCYVRDSGIQPAIFTSFELDLSFLSDQVITELKTLEAKNPKLHISSTWMPHMMVPTENMDGEDILTSFQQQRQQSGNKPMELLGTEDDFWGPTGPVATEVVDRERNLYRSPNNTKTSTFDFKVAHFQEHGMVLEMPDRVKHHYTVLKTPSFSPMGVVLRIIPAARRFIPITCITLIYYHLHLEEVTLHLYLVPNDCTIQKAIDDEEMKFQFARIHKPPPVDNLFIGSRYIVTGSEKLQITPKELELCYRSSKEFQLFSEIYVGHMDSEIKLQIKNKKSMKLIWEALLKPGFLETSDLLCPGLPKLPKYVPSLLHFMDQHREQLVARVTSVDPLLDKLHGLVLSEDSYEAVRAEITNQDKMRKLFSLSRSWSRTCKDQFYQALKETHPHLVMDLLEKLGGVSLGS
ncbi:NACHT, LRR and PYD domains-containing protein 1a [Apodemus speciosus]|uniref:NACHT, LRR and PYD domains-containing protein 1a n=1 Tax=Apodemus speciosus TaxID=105296 RepID=A0ABQ0FAV4_APOSI